MDEVTISSWPKRPVGGQVVGMTASGVQVEHPCGIVICICIHRSQHKNKRVAMEMMEYALSERS